MTDTELLSLFKKQIQILTDALDDYLAVILQSRKEMLTREGITEESSNEYVQILLMQARYLYNKRNTNDGEPRALRFAKNNLLFSQKIREGGVGTCEV